MTDLPWQPSASIETLKQRALIAAKVRAFFAERDVLEVETPLLAQFGVTDPHMDLLSADNPLGGGQRYFLQTSHEYAMKRLLAAGSGPIFQLAKAFRAGERGSRHNPEFTMLEWYRPGFDDKALMTEIGELVQLLIGGEAPEQVSYRDLFERELGIDPHTASPMVLETLARERIDIQMSDASRDDWLNLLIAEVIEPTLGFERPVFICDYPASQAALAQVREDARGQAVARRFELYIKGVELANGYLELTDAAEQRRRMLADGQQRNAMGRPAMAADPYLLAALENGLPDCAGVALGFDRLVMIALGCQRIEQVISFEAGRA